MRIYSMTATFGKLSHETLYLEPGLNVIHAPNEWGKSTWCAFLVAMLYGIDTRQKNTKTTLADKERYSPWSGDPMSGRMELNWNGRDITIERNTKGRIPFGEFRAYETETGLDIPELTAANCGQQLLGVEQSVFTRSGFIRLQDMPVTQDESLRRRLNNLVTTGDESGAGDQLGKQLRELKNSVRYNRTGLLPQAEAERDQIREQLEQKENLTKQILQCQERQAKVEEVLRALENHAVALRYENAKQGAEQIRAAAEAKQQLEAELSQLEQACKELPSLEEAESALQNGQELLSQQRVQLISQQQLPPPPAKPQIPDMYQNITPEEAVSAAEADRKHFEALQAQQKRAAKLPLIFGIITAALIAALVGSFVAMQYSATILSIACGILIILCAVAIAIGVGKSSRLSRELEDLKEKHPGIPVSDWVSHSQNYAKMMEDYRIAQEQYDALCGNYSQHQQTLNEKIQAYAGERTLEDAISYWESVIGQHTQLTSKRQELENATKHAAALQSVATTAPEPEFPDELELSAQDTQIHLQTLRFEQQQLQVKLGECIGRADTLRPEAVLRDQLEMLNRRIGRLEDYYRALDLALEVLHRATSDLQRRFAPRISKRAQEIFSRLTDGRYERITLSDDLSLQASARNEDTLRSAQWRSDGTVDQLYLSLRLAVAGEITPEAPLVLDDALIRFDDDRLKAALAILQEEAENKQVILFSCQSREKELAK